RSYTRFLGEKLGITGDYLEDLGTYSMLHDIGKLKVPLHILSKPARLTPEEFGIVKMHTRYGVDILGDSDWLSMARDICLCHHERWDGSGYPRGLQGKAIPLAARIVGLADVYDALRARRCYKEPFSHEESRRILLEGDGRVKPEHFDPEILALFQEHAEEFDAIFLSCSREEERA
nr:HD domain-containing phosphohydrolase [Synergistaceae bacterium]